MKGMNVKCVSIAFFSVLGLASVSAEQVLVSWQGADEQPYVTGSGISASNDLKSASTFSSSGQGSLDGDYGTFSGAPTSEGAFATGSFLASAGTHVLNFTITNTGTDAYELQTFRFDGYRQYNGSAMPVVSIVSGGSLTAGDLSFDPDLLLQKSGVAASGVADWDDVDISLLGLEDNVLDVGESVTFRVTAVGAAPNLSIDNVAVTGVISTPSFAGLVLASWQGGDERSYIEVDGLSASTDLNSGSTFNATGQGSLDGDYGTFSGAPTNEGTFATGSVVAPSGTHVLNFTIVNSGSISCELTAFHFDGYRQYNGSAMPIISIVSGGSLTVGDLSFDPNLLLQKSGVAVSGVADWDDVDISLSGLEDNVLDAGESVTFRVTAVGTAPNLFMDNIAVAGIYVGSVGMLDSVVSGESVVLSWGGVDGKYYSVEQSTNLLSGMWVPAYTNITGTGIMSVTGELTSAVAFFRVVQEN